MSPRRHRAHEGNKKTDFYSRSSCLCGGCQQPVVEVCRVARRGIRVTGAK